MLLLRTHNKELYFGVFLAAGFLVFAALGPGLYSSTAGYFTSWQYLVFEALCHQDPVRSFSISGVQMAVCSRCLGVYALFMAGFLMMPVYIRFRRDSIKTEKNWLIAAILLNLVDLGGNYFGLWTNTLISRFLLGGVLGLPLALILTNEFFTLKNRSNYGKRGIKYGKL